MIVKDYMIFDVIERKPGEKKKGHVPAIIYGHNIDRKQNILIFLSPKTVHDLQNSTNPIFFVKLGETTYKVFIKDKKYHPCTDLPINVDLFNIDEEKELAFPTKIIFINGVPKHINKRYVNILCKGKDIVPSVSCDISQYRLGTRLFVKDLSFPTNIKLLSKQNELIGSIKSKE